jgi:hypothetical protein
MCWTICDRFTPSSLLQAVPTRVQLTREKSSIRVSVRSLVQKTSRHALQVTAAAADAYAQSTLDPIEKYVPQPFPP